MLRAVRLRAAVVAVPLVLAGGAACSHGSSAPSCPNPASTTKVTMVDFAFEPGCVAVSKGATVTVTNRGAVTHTYTVKGTDVSVRIDSGHTQPVSLDGIAPGTYTVVCTIHPQMVGALKVGGG
jgi:plastocyanin